MNKTFLLFLFVTLMSCTKEIKNQIPNAKNFAIKAGKKDVYITDTIFFSYDKMEKYNEFALAHLISKKYIKDSICNAIFKLDFIKNNKVIYSQNVQINGFDNGSEWGEGIELDTISKSLKTISVGFAACGYAQNNYLFDIDEKSPSLIYEWQSMSDSGWGTWNEISGNSTIFYSRMVSTSPIEDNEAIDIAEYSDSIKFEKINEKWTLERMTPKGFVYRKKNVVFGE